jgi:putative Holliday junction resolvase
MRILGLDVGERRIGVAIADEGVPVALPVTVVERSDLPTDLDALARLVQEQGAEAVVIGLPISLNGSLGPQAQAVKAFGQELAARLSLPIEYWDERLSTVEAQRRLTSAGRRGPKAKARRDAAAAAIVLQGYLDSKAQGGPSAPFEL